MASERLIKELVVTAQLMGQELETDAARMFTEELSRFPESQVLEALARCRRELRSRLTLADVISRLDDGRPGPNEAWAMLPRSESQSVVWTEEMAAAMVSAQPLLAAGDSVAARMAFLEHYGRLVSDARRLHVPVRWMPSLGHDPNGRVAALREAIEKNRLSSTHAEKLLPHLDKTDLPAKYGLEKK
jgi:hypothetical protein